MINIEIIEYIKRQLQMGDTQEKIRSDLLANGWTEADINEAMISLVPQNIPIMAQSNEIKSPRKISSITSIIVILVLIVGTIFTYKIYKDKTDLITTDSTEKVNTEMAFENNNVEVVPIDNINKVDNLENSSNSSLVSSDLWTIYDKMTLALKNKDIKSFNTVSYTQVAPDEASQFNQIAPFLHDQNLKTVKSNYINKWQDEKQAIYSTNPQKDDNTEAYRYKQGIVMFINKDGSWKVLSSSSEIGWNVLKKGTNNTAAQIEKELQAMLLDSDKDGLTDQDEICGGAKQYDTKCIKTDPNKRDTDGNGWWDGIEEALRK